MWRLFSFFSNWNKVKKLKYLLKQLIAIALLNKLRLLAIDANGGKVEVDASIDLELDFNLSRAKDALIWIDYYLWFWQVSHCENGSYISVYMTIAEIVKVCVVDTVKVNLIYAPFFIVNDSMAT